MIRANRFGALSSASASPRSSPLISASRFATFAAAIQAQNVQIASGELGGLPQVAGQKLNATINQGLRSPETRELLAKIGIEPIITTPQEFADIIAREVPKWAAIVKATGVRVVE